MPLRWFPWVSIWLLLGGCLGNLNPDSECQLNEFHCDGTTAVVCHPAGAGKVGLSTKNVWGRTPCAETGTVCVVGKATAGCVASKTPCNPGAFKTTCDGNDLIACGPLAHSDVTTWPIKVPCGQAKFRTGKLQAQCSVYAAAAPCDQGKTWCDGPARVHCSSDAGLGELIPCEPQETCVAQGGASVCVGEAQPCTTAGAIKCATDHGVYGCQAPWPGSSAMYWIRKEACFHPTVCLGDGGSAACVADKTPCTTFGASKCLDSMTKLQCEPITSNGLAYWLVKANCNDEGKTCQTAGEGAVCSK
jgi:hypothetical protein